MFRRILTYLLFASTSALAASPKAPDLTKDPTLYVVGYAHLDTQWRWELPQTISEFLPNTMRDNFALFEKYPHYIFNFSGANRYRLMKEYYPADFEKVRAYVAAGRWFPSGSSLEESDVNSPSAESIIRQVLYGSEYFRRELGRSSAEYMLPDCFGFPSSLPTILAHCGIRGFSTQKLAWGSSAPVGGEGSIENTPAGTPFNVGIWEGPDGSSVIAAFNPGSYSADVKEDLSRSEKWIERVNRNGKVSGLFTDYHYYGTGDIGGAPSEPSVALVEETVSKNDGPLRVISSTAEQMFIDIDPRNANLPVYRGELELTEHSAGSLTSQAYHKRWNRRNELLADAAERASIAAEWLGGRVYPRDRLNDAWMLVATGQFHDDQAGTSTPKSYEYTWNTDVLAMNQFAQVVTSATEAIASSLDTSGEGDALVVYNPLEIEREEVVEATLPASPRAFRVIGPDGYPVASQRAGSKILFLAKVPPVSWSVYRVVPLASPDAAATSALAVSSSSMENARYRIKLDANGDVASIVDKTLDRELLSGPMRLAFQTHRPHDWPAWNMDWADQQKPPRGFVDGPATIRIAEQGPVRASLEIAREAEGSRFVTTIRLATGEAGNRIEFDEAIDWRSRSAALKAVIPLTASNPLATYNWQVGTIARGNNEPKRYEVASHEWLDLTDAGGSHGVTVLTGAKYGSDKPDDRTLRLTLIYTPGIGEGWTYPDQATQDWGRHDIRWGLAAHAGARQRVGTDWHALRLEQPLAAFRASKHAGALGRTFSLMRVGSDRVRVMAVKKAEHGDEVIVRLVELDGAAAPDVRVSFAAPIVSAREVDGQELPRGPAKLERGALVTSLGANQIRSYALRLGRAPVAAKSPSWQLALLPYDLRAAGADGEKVAGLDGEGRALPAELFPRAVPFGGIRFWLPREEGPNAVAARGQKIDLPAGDFRRVYVLAASVDGDREATFRIGDREETVTIPEWGGYVGQWDNRIWVDRDEILPPRVEAPPGAPERRRRSREVSGLAPGFVKPAPVAWFASHRHAPDGANEPYAFSYLFARSFELPPGAASITLPDDERIRVLAVTSSDESEWVEPAHPLYDTLEEKGVPLPIPPTDSPAVPAETPRRFGESAGASKIAVTVNRNQGPIASRAFAFETVSAPSADDAAATATVTLAGGRLDTNSAPLSVLVDGKGPVGQDEPAANVFFGTNTWGGRLVMDLGKRVPVREINTYSWHPGARGPQLYKVYGSTGKERRLDLAPESALDPAANGWTHIATVDTREADGSGGGQYGVRIANPAGIVGTWRYLLFDAFETESDDAWGQTFFSEIDVVADRP